MHFKEYGIKKLISTSYAQESKNYKYGYQLTLFEKNDPKFDVEKTLTHGKIYVLDNVDTNHDSKIDIEDLKWNYLEGDGDFRSAEVIRLRNEADIVVTNPPFSLFREFLAWIMEANKQFIIIGNKNCVTYKEVFPLIKDNRMWSGRTEWSGGLWFETKNPDDVDKVVDGVKMKNVSSVWFSNLDHGRRHQPLPLMTMEDNLKFSKHKEIKGKDTYDLFDNYNAIDVPFTNAIPSDYKGIMGVPISFLDKYCPEQFEIVGMCENINLYGLKTKVYSTDECQRAYLAKFGRPGTYDLNASGVIVKNGLLEKVYQRILIKAKEL